MLETRRRSTRVVLQVVVSLVALPYLLPLIVMVQGSLAGEGWRNYQVALSVPNIGSFFLNSAIIAACTMVLVYCFTISAAFGFAKLRNRFKEAFFWLMLAALTLPEVVLLTPLFVTFLRIGLYATLWAVVIPLAALQIPFTVLITRNYVAALPDQLFEAARVDGADVVRTFWHIVLPMTKPMAAAVMVLTLIGAWNDYLLPLVFLPNPNVQTITLLPSFFIGQYTDDQTKVLAVTVITALPEVIAYLGLQRFFERGFAAGVLR